MAFQKQSLTGHVVILGFYSLAILLCSGVRSQEVKSPQVVALKAFYFAVLHGGQGVAHPNQVR